MIELPEGWIETTLGEVVKLSQGLAINAKTKHLLTEDKSIGLPLLKINNLLNNTVSDYVNKNDCPDQCIVHKGDILYTRTGQVGDVINCRDGVLHNNSFKVTPIDKNTVSNNFLYWFLKQPLVKKYANKVAAGSVQLDLNHSAFKTTPFSYPTKAGEAGAIANILSSFDEKINLLREQNKTLENIAQTIFKEWFITGADDRWEIVRLGDYISVKHGFAFKGNLITTEPNEYILVTPGNFLIGGGFKSGKLKYYSSNDFPEDYIFNTNDLIVTMTDLSIYGDTLGFPALIPDCRKGMYLHNQRIGKVILEGDISKYFLYYLMKTKNYQRYIVGAASGSTVKHTSPTTICNYSFKLGPKKLIDNFSSITQRIVEKIAINSLHISELLKTRDTLLPKLMNGSVRVEGFCD